MYVCMYVCMYVRVCVCVCVCVYACMDGYVYAEAKKGINFCVCVCVCRYSCAHACVCVYVCMDVFAEDKKGISSYGNLIIAVMQCMHTYIHTPCLNVCVCANVWHLTHAHRKLCVCVCVCARARTRACMWRISYTCVADITHTCAMAHSEI